MNTLLSSTTRFTRLALLAGILCATALISCKKDKGPKAALPGDKVRTTFTLKINPQEQIFQTYDDIDIEEPKTLLSDIWVLEFDSLGRSLAVASVDEHTVGQDLTVNLIAGKNLTVYVVANAGSATFSTGMDLEAFKKATYDGRATLWDELPLIGKANIDVEWHDARIEAPVAVTAIGASVSAKFILQPDSGYELLTLQLKNAPKNYYYFSGMPVTTADVENSTIISVLPNNLYTYTIPENLQGIDPAITSTKDKVTNKPATYFSLIARNTATNKRVEFRLYPGDNVTNNFNINRNIRYIMTCNVNFDDPADKRITVLE